MTTKSYIIDLLTDILQGTDSLPRWVVLWLVWLLGVNLYVPFRLWFGDDSGIDRDLLVAMSWSVAAFFPVNVVLFFYYRGFSKTMAFSHLWSWIPLCIYLGIKLFGEEVDGLFSSHAVGLATLVFFTNLISLGFDFFDTHAVVVNGAWGRIGGEAPSQKKETEEPASS